MEYEEGNIGFSVLSVVRDPVQDHIERLALNVRRLQVLYPLVAQQPNGTREGVSSCLVIGPKPEFGLTEEILGLVRDQTDEADKYEECSNGELCDEYSRLVDEQQGILGSINEEIQSRHMDDTYAEGRRHDYSSAVEFWARTLIRKGVLVDMLDG